jgi:hypothetical protein
MDHTEGVTSPEAMAKIEAYETALFDALQLLGHARRISDVERARDVITKALQGTRYDPANRTRERHSNIPRETLEKALKGDTV